MKRDWSLLGKILEHIEADTLWAFVENADSSDREVILRHLELLQDAGYIKGFIYRSNAEGALLFGKSAVRITMSGYDLKDIINDKNLFNQVKDRATGAGVKLSWEFIKAAVPLIMKKAAEAVL